VNDLSRRNAGLWLGAILLLPLAIRVFLAFTLELSPDEAYYAAWARLPDAAYLDHPPLVAWLIAGMTAVLGESELAVRLPALAAGAILPWLLYATSRTLGASRKSSVLATAAGTLTLLSTAGGLLTTPDAPLALAWGLAVYFLARAIVARRQTPLAGAAVALAAALASKLTGLLLWGWALIETRGIAFSRRVLWFAAGLVGLVPVIAWNAARGWPMFAFHGARVAGRSGPSFATLGEFLAGQLGLLCIGGAVLVGAAWIAGLRRGAERPLRFAATLSCGPVLSVVALSLFTKVEANWIGPAYFSGFVAAALWLDRSRAWRRFATVAASFAFAVSLAAEVHAVYPYLPLPADRDPSAQLHGWRELARVVREARDGLPVLTSRYQEASELAFYLADPTVTTLPAGARLSQFDFWPAPTRRAAIALCVWREGGARAQAAKRLVIFGRRYEISRCDPAHWREPPAGKVNQISSGR
jgi:4-amino-4-deoxy-L-arabinose transferase-like glycosyltransferase